jgi:branched-chain amino acid transport system permease protein
MSTTAVGRLTGPGRHVAIILGALVLGQVLSAPGAPRDGGLPVPLAVVAGGGLLGLLTALVSVGLVLVYRATRVINFAQAGFAAASAVLFVELVTFKRWPWFAALFVSVAAAAAAGAVTELLFIRRFSSAPRLVVTVATIGVGQLLSGVAIVIPRLLGDTGPGRGAADLRTPFSRHRWTWDGVPYRGDAVAFAVVALTVLVAFAVFLRRSRVGTAIRGAAENADRAELLGISTRTLSSIVWVITGALAGLGSTLGIGAGLYYPSIATGAASAVVSTLLVRSLAAAVVARMEDLPLAVSASLGISVLQQVVSYRYLNQDIIDVALLGVIVAGLLAQRQRLGRADAGATSSWEVTDEVRPIPAELMALPSVRRGVRWTAAAGAAVVLGLPFVLSVSQVNQISLYVILAIIGVSLVVLTGWAGQVSLGQFGFAGIGAIVAGALLGRAHLPFLVVLAVATVAGAGVALVIGLPALRITGLFLAVSTLAFATVTGSVLLDGRYLRFLRPDDGIGRPRLLWLHFDDERAFYFLCVAALGLAIFVATGLRTSRVGRTMIGLRDNERAAQALGVNLVRTRLTSSVISGGMAGFAGCLYAVHQRAVDQSAFGPDQSIAVFLMAVLGGLGSVPGVALGALYLGLGGILFKGVAAQLFLSSGGVLLVLLVAPRGLVGLVVQGRDAVLRRVAIRRRIMVPSLLASLGMAGQPLDRIPLAPKPVTAEPDPLPRRYPLPSRIRLTGSSQQAPGWDF